MAVDNLAGFYFEAEQANGGETPPAAAQMDSALVMSTAGLWHTAVDHHFQT